MTRNAIMYSLTRTCIDSQEMTTQTSVIRVLSSTRNREMPSTPT